MKKSIVCLFVLGILVFSGAHMQAEKIGGLGGSGTPFFGQDDPGCAVCWCQGYLMGVPFCQSCVNSSGACDTTDTTQGCFPSGRGCYGAVVNS